MLKFENIQVIASICFRECLYVVVQYINIFLLVEWLRRSMINTVSFQNLLASSLERHSAKLFPAWLFWQAVLNFSHICIKTKTPK